MASVFWDELLVFQLFTLSQLLMLFFSFSAVADMPLMITAGPSMAGVPVPPAMGGVQGVPFVQPQMQAGFYGPQY